MNLSNPANLLIAGIYLVTVGILAFFSLFGVYILNRYGSSTPLALTISIVYSFLFLKIFADSFHSLNLILS
jgi:hypothetical protein